MHLFLLGATVMLSFSRLAVIAVLRVRIVAKMKKILNAVQNLEEHKPHLVVRWELVIVFVTPFVWLAQVYICLYAVHHPTTLSIAACGGIGWLAFLYPLWVFTLLIPLVLYRWWKRYS